MNQPWKFRWLALLAASGLAIGAFVLLRTGRPDGFLLAGPEVPLARANLALRGELRDLEARIAARRAPDDGERQDLEAQRDLLAAQLFQSRFGSRSREELAQALDAAEHGHLSDDDEPRMRAVYGGDGRLDHGEIERRLEKEKAAGAGGVRAREIAVLEKALEASRGVGAWMPKSCVRPDGALRRVRSLGDALNLCSNQKFVTQPRAAIGTAFLVAPDRVMTARHVLTQTPEWRDLVLVFGFEVGKDGSNPTSVGAVYRPTKLIDSDGDARTYDWALVELDRAVEGGRVLPIADDPTRAVPRPNDTLYLWGHSAGSPKKFMKGKTLSSDARTNVVRAELDAFGGDSGSPVFDDQFRVVGLLFGGGTDWIDLGGCRGAAEIGGTFGGEYVTGAGRFRPRAGR